MNSNEGINVGLQIWLIFLIGLALMGYSAFASVILGAIAGAAGGFIVYWYRGTFVSEDTDSSDDSKTQTNSIFNRARLGFSRIQPWNRSGTNETEEQSRNWMARWIRRNPRRSMRSRRR